MIDYVRQEVSTWLFRGLDAYYPIVFVDCVHIKVFRKKKAATEAFYVILGVTEEVTRKVLGIYKARLKARTAGATCLTTCMREASRASA